MSLPALLRRHDRITVLGLFAFVNGVISIGLMAVVALVTGAPFIFPSLGPTAFLLFYTPMLPAVVAPKHARGHAIGAAAGYFALVVFGLQHAGQPWRRGHGSTRRRRRTLPRADERAHGVGTVPHPPAGATTLIVSLGILREPWQLAVLMLAVFLLVLQGLGINRLAGIPYPLWGPATDVAGPTSALLEP